MKKPVRRLPVAEAVKQARADLHLEYAAVPEWGRHIFTQHDRYSDALCRFGGGLLFWPSPIFGQRSNKSGSPSHPSASPPKQFKVWIQILHDFVTCVS